MSRIVLALLIMAGCAAEDTEPVTQDFEAQADDFQCITQGTSVRNFYITNPLGHLDEALAVANNPEGGVYPVGTIIQLVPAEAMVKRGPDFSPETQNWEFFELQVSSSGTTINKRGTTEVNNLFGGNCFGCHAQAEPQWDLICEQDHGCAPLGLDASAIENAQNNDPRCP